MYTSSTYQKKQKTPEQLGLQKISSFITRFHAVLLPKANEQGVFRYLTQQEQLLLSKLDNPINSILTGCFAIDSCLSNISQAQQNLTDNILKSLTNFCSVWQKIQNELIQNVENNNLTATKIEILWKQVQESIKNILKYCHNLPFSQQNEQVRKQEKIICKSQQDITFKLGSMKLFQDSQQIISDKKKQSSKSLQQENARLKEQLVYTQKKVVQLQLKVNKLTQSRNQQLSKEKSNKKNSQTAKQKDNDIGNNNNWPHFVTQSSNPAQQIQINNLKQKLMIYDKNMTQMSQQFHKQKRRLLKQIKMLQQQLRIADASQDRELVQLLQQLQDQIQSLREQRRYDERIVQQIQYKLDGMTISKQSRINRVKQSRTNLKYSNIYRNRDNQINQIQERNPTFKKSRGRQRIFTSAEDISRSSYSIPKIQDYKKYEREKFNWKAQRIRPIKDNYNRGNDLLRTSELKHSYILPQQPNAYNYERYEKQQATYETPSNQNAKNNKLRNFQTVVPITQNKFGLESIMKQQDKNAQYQQKNRRNYAEQRNNQQAKYQAINDNFGQQNPSKASKWHKMISARQNQTRLKTSRI